MRRRLLAGLAGSLLLGHAGLATASGRVVLARSTALRSELGSALAAGEPLVVMVSLEGCPFCRDARDSYIGPMRDEQRLAVVQVDLRSNSPVSDFTGVATTHDALTRNWRISIAPTVLFFGPGGREIAPRLTGAYLPDFYGAYLEERVRQARKIVRG